MAECRFLGECAFYNDRLKDMPTTGEFIKMVYCLKTPDVCLRLKQAEAIPVSNIRDRTTPIVQDTAIHPAAH